VASVTVKGPAIWKRSPWGPSRRTMPWAPRKVRGRRSPPGPSTLMEATASASITSREAPAPSKVTVAPAPLKRSSPRDTAMAPGARTSSTETTPATERVATVKRSASTCRGISASRASTEGPRVWIPKAS